MENKKNKIYSEFFSNIAVAWFSAGVIIPFFVQNKPMLQAMQSIFAGILLAYVCLEFSINIKD